MKKLTLVLIALVGLALPSFAQTASNSSTLGGELSGLRATSKQFHVTANTTINVATSTCKLYGIAVNCSNAGTTWAITVSAVSAGNQGTAANFWGPFTLTTNSGNPFVIAGIPATGYVMQGGINITFTGTAGVADIWVLYK